MGLLDFLRTPEYQIGDFLMPWGMIISTLGFLAAWILVLELERRAITRHIWHVPLFFVALAVLFGCVFGLVLAP
ncbi:MAG: DUF1656 domain-containing protein [Terrimicrobiaceae bacterium]